VLNQGETRDLVADKLREAVALQLAGEDREPCGLVPARTRLV